MDIGRVPFHLSQLELYLGLRQHLLFVDTNDARFLPEPSGTAAPARPDTEPEGVYRQGRRRDYVEHTHEGLHAVDFTTHIFAQHAALEVRQDCVAIHGGGA